jgi:cytochrome c553
MKLKLMLVVAMAGMLSIAQGATVQENWDQNCAKCHGKEGKGDTKMGEKLGVKNYTDAAVQAKFTDDQAFKAIKDGVMAEGKKAMPAFGEKLSDGDIKALVQHIRELKK